MIDIDGIDDLNRLAADLSDAGVRIGWRVHGIVEETAGEIEEQAKEWAPRKRLPHYARTINHTTTIEPGAVVAEIGPDADVNGQAKLGPVFEYGTAETAPRAHVGPSFDRSIPGFTTKIADAGGKIL